MNSICKYITLCNNIVKISVYVVGVRLRVLVCAFVCACALFVITLVCYFAISALLAFIFSETIRNNMLHYLYKRGNHQ